MIRRTPFSVVALLCVTIVHAEVKTFTPQNGVGDFHDPTNWTPQGVPGPGDRVVIVDQDVCNLRQDATIETIVVGELNAFEFASGVLVIGDPTGTNAVTLTLTNHTCGIAPTCGNVHSIVHGTLELLPNAALSFTTQDHTISGNGQILSRESTNPEIRIAQGITFRNELDFFDTGPLRYGGIRGALRILGPGRVLNDGIIQAVTLSFSDPNGDSIEIDAITEDTPDGRWIVNCEARMVFKQSAALEGDFEDLGETQNLTRIGGTFVFDNDAVVLTCGSYIRLGCGGLSFPGGPNTNAMFGYRYYIDPPGCPDPVTTPVSNACADDIDATSTSTGLAEPCVAGG